MFAKKLSLICSVFAMMAVLPHCDSFAAAKKSAGKQSAIQTGTKVRTKVEVSGLYDQECYDAYRTNKKETYAEISHYLRTCEEYDKWRTDIMARDHYKCTNCNHILTRVETKEKYFC